MKELQDTLQIKLEAYVREELIPSISLGIVTKDSRLALHAGYKSLLPAKEPIQEDTLYDLASLSKVVSTLTMILKLMEEDRISLSTPLQTLLPGFIHPDITIAHLLLHTSGLAADNKEYKLCKNKEELMTFVYRLAKKYPTGTMVEYSCFNFLLLGFLIEKLTGSFEAYAQQTVFEPLAMQNTCYNPKEKGFLGQCAATEVTKKRGVICGEVHDGKAYLMNGVAGNAGVFSTVEDLSHLVQMYLSYGAYQGKEILKPETIRLLQHCYTSDLNARRTYGWYADDPHCAFGTQYKSPCLFHTGFSGTSLYLDFPRQTGIILLTNRIHPSRENTHITAIRNELHDMILSKIAVK